jgi:hypothetical protein
MLYHLNIGYPLLDADTRMGGVDTAFAEQFSSSPPRTSADTVERFDPVTPLADADGDAIIVLDNRSAGVHFELGYDRTTLPDFGVWRAYQSGIFALGLEPSSGLGSPDDSYAPGHPDFLEPEQSRCYRLQFAARSLD